MKIVITLVAALMVCVGAGCEMLGGENTGLVEFKRGVEQTLVESQEVLAEIRADVKELQSLPDLTPEENRLLYEYLLLQAKVEKGVEEGQAVLSSLDADTDNELLIQVALGIGAALGIPFIGVIGAFLKRGRDFNSVVSNIGEATTAKSVDPSGNTVLTLDGTYLKTLNIAAGVEAAIRAARASEGV